MEKGFMQIVDNEAAKVHALMMKGEVRDLTDAQCCDWARFIMSLWFRTPLDVRGLRSAVDRLVSPAARGTLLDANPEIEMPPETASHLQMKIIRHVIDDAERGAALINMEWAIAPVNNSRELFISDWPMCMPENVAWLGAPDSYVTLPLGPDRMFLAAGSRTKLDEIARLPDRELIMRQNRSSVRSADKFVGAKTSQGCDFVTGNFGRGDRYSISRSIDSR
jgi:hypothetical protein